VPSSPEGVSIVTNATLASVRELAEHLKGWCERAGLDPAAAFDIELAMVEAANNVVEHGYGPGGEGTIGLFASITDDVATVILTDTGSPVPQDFFDGGDMPDPMALGGRGSGIIRACVDDVSYVSGEGENRLVLTKRCQLAVP
jgi:serine/threonine-protein kinase RsbW